MWYEDIDRIHLAQDRLQEGIHVNMLINLPVP
jgi:hypothetical protein